MALLNYCVYSNEKGLVVRVEGFRCSLAANAPLHPVAVVVWRARLARLVGDRVSTHTVKRVGRGCTTPRTSTRVQPELTPPLSRPRAASQKLPLLLDAIFAQLSRVAEHVDGALFAAMQESLRRLYHNTFVNPTKLANELRMSLLLQIYWTPVDKYGVIAQTTLEQLKSFAKDFLQRMYIQCLVQGNVSMEGALTICRRVADTLRCRPLKAKDFPTLAVCQARCSAPLTGLASNVPLGERCCRVRTFNPDDKNCSTVNYYQCGRATVVKCCMSELLVQLLDEPVFNALRTREQLGYDVTCQRRTTYNTLGFLITVNSQADKYTMDHVDSRIEAFLRDFSHALKTQCTRRFKFVKRSLRDEKECVDFDLQDEVSRNWKEITSNTYMFDRAERERQCLKNIRLKDLRKWCDARRDGGACSCARAATDGASRCPPHTGSLPTWARTRAASCRCRWLEIATAERPKMRARQRRRRRPLRRRRRRRRRHPSPSGGGSPSGTITLFRQGRVQIKYKIIHTPNQCLSNNEEYKTDAQIFLNLLHDDFFSHNWTRNENMMKRFID
ncbi:nardilysin-like [Frankliniella occidentalis]|uniref:Nardilysin-like n=1 Tax=Frankliniella occidentalis TaxID=133901 RepID=A0A9C6UBK2_FRAOC|nr:nardilysin-like [Frankliniella occidentalis]